MPKKEKPSPTMYIVSGQEVTTYKAMMITARSDSQAIEIYDELWENGELIVTANEFDIEIAK